MWTCWECNERTLSSPGASGPFLWFLFICISQIKTATAPCIAQCCFWSMLWLYCLPPLRAVCQRDPLASLSLFLSLCLRVCASQLSVCEEMLRELQGIVLCQDSLQLQAQAQEPACCDHSLCPWTSDGRGRRRWASATASCAWAPASLNPSPTDWRRRQPWWHEGAVTFASARSAGASRAFECARPALQEHRPATARRV